jgi:alkaline phosphatase D
MNFKIFKISLLTLLMAIVTSCSTTSTKGPYLATGIKIGEVSQTDAIIWVRLTKNAERVGNDAPMPTFIYIHPETGDTISKGRPNISPKGIYPEGYDISTYQGATPGSNGKVRLKYKAKDGQKWEVFDWQTVEEAKSYAHQFVLSRLASGQTYEILVEARPLKRRGISATIEGKFTTAPEADIPADVNFIVTTGTSYPDVDSETGYKIYPNSLKLDPDFFVHTGDILYYDYQGKNLELAKWHWDRMYSFPNNIDYHRQVPSYFIKDDHDTWKDDCFPGMNTKFMGDFTYEQGTKLFLEEVPMGDLTYRTIRWGKDLQIWLVEGRDYRSPNNMEDGPEKSIWGKEQMDWFKTTVKTSDATYKVLISPTPVVGPDRTSKKDNHANLSFKTEGDMLRKFISEQKNMVTVCGDRHWQYVSKDSTTGLIEFSCGPGSDAHAGGWSQDMLLPEHLYLNVVGGFLEGAVTHKEGKAELIFRHYGADGEVLNEYPVDFE